MANYEIVIRNETNGAKKSPIAGSGSVPSDTTGQSGGGISPVRQAAAGAIVAANTYIKPFVDQMVTQHVLTVALRTGAQEQEERMAFTMNIAQKVYGFGSSIVTGALMGSAGGPVGAVVGAVVGGVMNLAVTAVEYSNKQKTMDLQRAVDNIGLRYANMRAGGSVASFSGSRMKNQ